MTALTNIAPTKNHLRPYLSLKLGIIGAEIAKPRKNIVPTMAIKDGSAQ